ncbi:hypothetical protein BH24CHL5_BH24CHL5_05890 [soil metagenome]
MSDSPAAPPGRGLFSLEGRPAAGLYLIAWLVAGLGLVLLFIGIQSGPPLRGVLLVGSLVLILLGLTSGAGYQILLRRGRAEPAFRGASPVLLFGVQFALVNLASLLLIGLGVSVADSAAGFFAATVVLLLGYGAVIWLFALRPGVMSWRGLGLADRVFSRRALSDAGFGAGAMLVVALGAGVWGAVVSLLLGTRPPSVVPPVETTVDIALVAIGAAVLVPIGEELFFRGYALTAWLRDRGPRSALIRSTLFFAVVHVATLTSETFSEGARQALLVVLVIAPVGLALGWLFIRRGLVAAVAGHAAYNLFGVLVLILSRFAPPIPPPA